MGRRYDKRRVVEDLLKLYQHSILEVLEGEEVDSRRYLIFLSKINKFFDEKRYGKIIILGGFACELYSGLAYRTGDVDIIVEDASDVMEEFLLKIGFVKESRVYIMDEGLLISKAIDIVRTFYDKPKKPLKWYVDNDYVYIFSLPKKLLYLVYHLQSSGMSQ